MHILNGAYLVGASDDTEEQSREEDETRSEGDCGNVAIGDGGGNDSARRSSE